MRLARAMVAACIALAGKVTTGAPLPRCDVRAKGDDVDETKLSILEKTGSTDVQELVRELRHCRAIVDEAQRVANCFNGDVLTKSGTEFVAVLDNLRAALAAYVDPE